MEDRPLHKEEQPKSARLQVVPDLLPEFLCVIIVFKEFSELLCRVFASLAAARFKIGLDPFSRPVDDCVRRVVEHLAHDLPSDAGIGAALHLDKRRHRILVDEEMIERPPRLATLGIRDASLAVDEEPAARLARCARSAKCSRR